MLSNKADREVTVITTTTSTCQLSPTKTSAQTNSHLSMWWFVLLSTDCLGAYWELNWVDMPMGIHLPSLIKKHASPHPPKKKHNTTHLPSFQGILVQEGNVTGMFVCRHLHPTCPCLASVASSQSSSSSPE